MEFEIVLLVNKYKFQAQFIKFTSAVYIFIEEHFTIYLIKKQNGKIQNNFKIVQKLLNTNKKYFLTKNKLQMFNQLLPRFRSVVLKL